MDGKVFFPLKESSSPRETLSVKKTLLPGLKKECASIYFLDNTD